MREKIVRRIQTRACTTESVPPSCNACRFQGAREELTPDSLAVFVILRTPDKQRAPCRRRVEVQRQQQLRVRNLEHSGPDDVHVSCAVEVERATFGFFTNQLNEFWIHVRSSIIVADLCCLKRSPCTKTCAHRKLDRSSAR